MKIAILLPRRRGLAEKLPGAPPSRPPQEQPSQPPRARRHSSDFEAENGIVFQFSGFPRVSTAEPTWSDLSGGRLLAEVKFVANENGYQPESSPLPWPPPSPPIPRSPRPDRFARLEDEADKQRKEGNAGELRQASIFTKDRETKEIGVSE
ncbi:cuticle protein AMP1B-like [Penaeus monodon]|uniref:cuticle protein AMP1B-like n=1 Tax=Penaeus monodon TaxID=6687 RepID=UPI0018A72DA8|nr:cuticle protein AMP1B-like [Penaeus monodon]